MKKLNVQDISLRDRRALVRVDFNVPMEGDRITDDTRIRAALSTLEYVASRGGRCVLMCHFGRPKGESKPEFSLRPVGERLQELTGRNVRFATDCVGEAARSVVDGAAADDIVLLENLRFHAGETANDPGFAAELAAFGDLYVNDAFGAAHRAHASTVGVTHHFDECVSGLLMDKELENLGGLLESPRRPFVAVLGGAKVSGKAEVIENLLGKVDTILIGGGMAFTFFRVLGVDVGASLVEESVLDDARRILRAAKASSTELILPEDLVVAERFATDCERREVLATDIPEGWMGLDIGSKTSRKFSEILDACSTVFWNGPMGVFEMEPFSKGTRAVARAIAQVTDHGARSVVGGGDSVAALTQAGLAHKVTHVSTGGGASLEFMAGKVLPGVEALDDAPAKKV